MLARYRYRIYPDDAQRQSLARAFGCARVVYNDALSVREKAPARGERISDVEIQRRVTTLAKATPEREWLGEVASVALVQACQDARRAYRNWYDYLAGKRKGPKVGHPKFRRKHGRQSIRLMRNGFAARAEAVRGEGRRYQGAVVAGASVGTVFGHRDHGNGRSILRLLRGRPGGGAISSVRPGNRGGTSRN